MNIERLSGYRTHLIEKNQFYSFLEELANGLRETNLTELEYEVNGITSTYNALIDYFRQGISDPERDRVYHQLVGRALQLNDYATLALHGAEAMPYYTSHHKAARREPLRHYLLQLEAFTEGIHSTTDPERLKQWKIGRLL